MKLHNTLIAGVIGTGKTIWMVKLASTVLKQGYSVLFLLNDDNPKYIKDWFLKFCTEEDCSRLKLYYIKYGTSFEYIKLLIAKNPTEYVFIDGVDFRDSKKYKLLTIQHTLILSSQAPMTCYDRSPSDQYAVLRLETHNAFDLLISHKERYAQKSYLYDGEKCIDELDLSNRPKVSDHES